jgi:hypothetical protein
VQEDQEEEPNRTERTSVKRGALVLVSAATLLGVVGSAASQAEIEQSDTVRVTFTGRMSPTSLPRDGEAPIRVAVGAKIAGPDGASPPPLQRIRIEINRYGRLDRRGLPVCRFNQIQPSTTARARQACGDALVGRGAFSSNVLLPEISPFPSDGTLDAFNGVIGCSELQAFRTGRVRPSSSRTQEGRRGKRTRVRDPKAADRGHRDAQCRPRPAILAHVYGTTPVPTSYTIPFAISRGSGEYGLTLSAPMPNAGSGWGYITGLSLNLGKKFKVAGQSRSYLSAGCPAPDGVGRALFRFARATFFFGSEQISSTLARSCRPRG